LRITGFNARLRLVFFFLFFLVGFFSPYWRGDFAIPLLGCISLQWPAYPHHFFFFFLDYFFRGFVSECWHWCAAYRSFSTVRNLRVLAVCNARSFPTGSTPLPLESMPTSVFSFSPKSFRPQRWFQFLGVRRSDFFSSPFFCRSYSVYAGSIHSRSLSSPTFRTPPVFLRLSTPL